MYVLMALGMVSFLLCLVLTPVFRDLFLRWGLVDLPDSERKFHVGKIPRMGGLPIVLSCMGAFVALFVFSDRKLYIQHGEVLHGVLPAAGVIFLVGLLDDVRGLRPAYKLLGQILAASTAVALGVRISLNHLSPAACVVLSVCWLVCCTNAVNLIDGMDGLATGVSVFATATVLGIALIYGHYGLALVTAPLLGALIAFLRYNFSPASVFLGDCGSLTIGFLLGCFGLVWSQHARTVVGLTAPLMALALPLTDVGLAICRRFLRKVPIFSADRGHIHHKVQALGFSTRRTAVILYSACAAFASLAVMATVSTTALPFLVVFLLLLLIGISQLGYREFAGAARAARNLSSFRSSVQHSICVEDFVHALESANSVQSCWEILRTACRQMHFRSAELKTEGMRFREVFHEGDDALSFTLELNLGVDSTLVLVRTMEARAPRITMSTLHRLQAAMSARLGALQSSSPAVTSVA